MHLRARNVMSRQEPPNMEPAIVRASNEAIVCRDGDGEKVGIGREGGERIPGFEVPELERKADSARRPFGSAATAIPRPPLARAESELFRRRCHVIENWMRLRRNPLLQSRRATTSRHVCRAEASARIASEVPCPSVHHQAKKP